MKATRIQNESIKDTLFGGYCIFVATLIFLQLSEL